MEVIADNRDADESLKRVVALGVFDKSRKIIKRQSYVEIPVIRSISGYELVMQEEPAFYRKKLDLFHALQGKIPQECAHLIPRGWFLLGEVIVVKIHPDLRAYEHIIGQALLDFYPRCCTVLADEGIFGPFREPVRRVIVGKKTQTVHKENKVIFN